MENVYEHEGYAIREFNGNIVSIRKGEVAIHQSDAVESKGTGLVPSGTRGIVIALRKPMTNPVGEHFVWVAFESISRTAHMKVSDLIVHGR